MRAGPSPTSRAISGALAGILALLFLISEPLSFAQAGCPGTGAVLAIATIPLVVFLGLIALAPAPLQRALDRWTAIDLADGGHVAAAVVMAGTLFFVLGWGGAVGAAATLEHARGGCAAGASSAVTGDSIVRGVLINLAVFALPVLFYVGFVHGAPLRTIGLGPHNAARGFAIGVGLAIAFLVALAVTTTILMPVLPESALKNDEALAIAQSVNLAGAIVLAVGSSLGEEIFFRGFLQPRIGLIATSLLFAMAHINYGSISEVVVVLLLSLALGVAYKVTRTLWTPIAAHFTFNLLQLLAAIYVPR